jgi:plastocyanin
MVLLRGIDVGLSSLRTEFRADVAGLNSGLASLRDEFRSEISSIKSEISSIRSEISSIRTELDVVHADAHDMRNEIHSIHGEIRELHVRMREIGKTVVVRNAGSVAHEFTLGDEAGNAAHAKMMASMPDMKRNAPNAVTIEPGKTAEIIWRFSKPGRFEFACLIPGHYGSGMHGAVTVK